MAISHTTMGALGGALPHGTRGSTDGALRRDMLTKRWNLRVEKELGKIRDKKKNDAPARFAARVVAKLYDQLGGVRLEGGTAADMLTVNQMAMGDVLYAYLWLRNEVIGSDFQMELTCPRCRHSFQWKADLTTIDVRVVEEPEDAFWDYTLRDTIQIRGKDARVLRFGPPRWDALERSTLGGERDTGTPKAGMIIGSFRGHDDEPDIALRETDLDEMSKFDLESIVGQVDLHHIGPDMSIESGCARCSRDFKVTIDWVYDSFFAISGRAQG